MRKGDVSAVKNYLPEKELKSLNRIVTMYLDYAEDQAERRNPMYMKDWEGKLNAFLKFNEREILTGAGSISHEVAKELAEKEYEKYNQHRVQQPEKDDFDVYLEAHEWVGKK